MTLRNVLLVTSLAAFTATGALAQTTYHQRHSINARQNRQQARINHGLRDGQITPNGAAHAERNQARIARLRPSRWAARPTPMIVLATMPDPPAVLECAQINRLGSASAD